MKLQHIAVTKSWFRFPEIVFRYLQQHAFDLMGAKAELKRIADALEDIQSSQRKLSGREH